MTAKVHLDCRREPSKLVSIRIRDEERCLREIVLHRDIEHHVIGQPRFQRHNGRGISPERLRSKSVNLKYL